MGKKRVILITSTVVVTLLFGVLVFPKTYNKYKTYKLLKNKMEDVTTGLQSISEVLPSASEVYKVISAFGVPILYCGVSELEDSESVASTYIGQELAFSENRLIEFILPSGDETKNLLVDLSVYGFAYESIDYSSEEDVVIRIYCN